MIGALERFEVNHRVDLAAVEIYERWRATARDTKGRVLKGNSKPFVAPELPEGKINLSDPDSRVMRTQAPRPGGLQRPSGRQRSAGDPGGRDHQRRARFRAARADVRSDDARTLRAGRRRDTGGGPG